MLRLQEMMLAYLLVSVLESLARKVNLAVERKNLVEALRIYGAVKEIRVPRLLSFKTHSLTAWNISMVAGLPTRNWKPLR